MVFYLKSLVMEFLQLKLYARTLEGIEDKIIFRNNAGWLLNTLFLDIPKDWTFLSLEYDQNLVNI